MLVAMMPEKCRAQTPPSAHPALAQLPPIMIWAWERREDLRWLPPHIGVAYVVTSIKLIGARAVIHPRLNPVMVPKGTVMVPVVHVDPSFMTRPDLTPAQADAVVTAVVAAAGYAKDQVVQLDFEVGQSQRPFLAAVVRRIRQGIPSDLALSITAIASWCLADRWLGDLPADEVVPMLFRMGVEKWRLREQLSHQGRFSEAKCQGAAGYALNEPYIDVGVPRRYFFSPRAWTESGFNEFFNKIQ